MSVAIGILIRRWRRHVSGVARLLALALAVASLVLVYFGSMADLQARDVMEIAAAALASAAVVLLFRGLEGRFSIQTRRSGNWQSSSVLGVLLWIACFAVLSAAFVLSELRHPY
jgi:hypothetical protein